MDTHRSHASRLYDEKHPPDAMLGYLKSMEYAFKYDDVIKNTKREIAKQRRLLKKGVEEETCQNTQDLNFIDHYPQCYVLLTQYFSSSSPKDDWKLLVWDGDFDQLKKNIGYRAAYVQVVDFLFGLPDTSSLS